MRVDTPGAFVGKSGDTVVVRIDRKIAQRVPMERLNSLTIAARGVSLSGDVVEACAAKHIPLLVITAQSRLAAVVTNPEMGNNETRLKQLDLIARVSDAFEVAREMVRGKLKNQRALILSLFKYKGRLGETASARVAEFRTALGKVLAELDGMTFGEDRALHRARLMSVEGRGAAVYWDMFGLALGDRAPFSGRLRKGARDLVNSLLNYAYAILESRVHLALVRASLLPEAGFLHADQAGKPVLAYDLMEEFRPVVVDRTVAAVLGRGRAAGISEDGLLDSDTRRMIATAVTQRLATLVDYRGREMRIEQIIERQASLLAAHARGEAHYRPYLAKW